MNHIIFEESESYKIAILIKPSSFIESSLRANYIVPLVNQGVPAKDFIGFDLAYTPAGKPVSAKERKLYLGNLLKALDSLGIDTLYCADSEYFKTLTGERKAEPNLGNVIPCKIEGFEHMSVLYGVNHSSIFYNPLNQDKLDNSLKTLVSHLKGGHIKLGSNIIHSSDYPQEASEIALWLEALHEYPELTLDIETFSLKHYSSGIGTVGFAWNQHEGIAFPCDYKPLSEPKDGFFGEYVINPEVRTLLFNFLNTYTGKLTYHNAPFDVKILIYNLWMKDITDREGLLIGLGRMTRDFEDTKVISYLATNSCAGNNLSLKDQAQEFAGNYAESEINDIRKIPLDKLLKYNLVDCLSTWFVKNKQYPQMVKDNQEHVYLNTMKPSLVTIIDMELTGMPMCMDEILKGEKELLTIEKNHSDWIQGDPYVEDTLWDIQEHWLTDDYHTRKGKAKNPDKIVPKLRKDMETNPTAAYPQVFNPNSGKQLGRLLHVTMGLPIIETTPTGEPATDDKTLESLQAHCSSEEQKELIEHLKGLGKVTKILTAFLPHFKEAQLGKDGIYYLFGSFNLNGTVSGRLSASAPNMQQIPSGSTYAKVIKRMFKGNDLWVFSGADFCAMEDVVNAILTQDPAKIEILAEGYDGHCYRMYHYWNDKFPNVPKTVEAINALKKPWDSLRGDSKPVSFALQYWGTYHTLMKNCGFTKAEAQAIELNYHTMYKVSKQWGEGVVEKASEDGYSILAYGLKIRTPMLKQVIYGSSSMPSAASAEARTLNNAASGQSYGIINTMAANEFMRRARASKFKHEVKLSALIHDAVYPMFVNRVEVAKWVNDNLIECMCQEANNLPELYHPDVKLSADLDLFYPSWADATTLNHNMNQVDLYKLTQGIK